MTQVTNIDLSASYDVKRATARNLCALMMKRMAITVFMLATLVWAAAQQQPSAPPGRSGGQPGAQAQEANAPVTEGCPGGSDPNYTLTAKAGTTYKLNIPRRPIRPSWRRM
jgi:hypothetical protein